jgi:hypothetical protein
MKKNLLKLSLIAFLSGFLTIAFGQVKTLSDYAVKKPSTGPTENRWYRCSYNNLSNGSILPGVITGTSTGNINFKIEQLITMWDMDSLYIGIRIRDDAGLIANEDSVELFFDTNANGGAFETATDKRFKLSFPVTTSAEYALPHNARYYFLNDSRETYKIAIPWSGLGITPAALAQIRFDIRVSDVDVAGAAPVNVQTYGSTTKDPIAFTDEYGILELRKDEGAAATGFTLTFDDTLDATGTIIDSEWGFPTRKASHALTIEGGKMKINIANKGNYDGLEFDFLKSRILNLAANPFVKIKLSATDDCSFRLYPWDVLANYNIPGALVPTCNIKAGADTTVFFSFKNLFYTPTSGGISTGFIDSTKLRQLLLNINPGAAYTGIVTIDEIVVGSDLFIKPIAQTGKADSAFRKPVIGSSSENRWFQVDINNLASANNLPNVIVGAGYSTANSFKIEKALFMYDKDSLYAGLRIRDDGGVSPGKDSVELFFDTNANGGAFESGIDKKFSFVYKVAKDTVMYETNGIHWAIAYMNDANRQNYEIAIPWSLLGIDPISVNSIKCDVRVNDVDGDVMINRQTWASYFTDPALYTTQYGTINLNAAKAEISTALVVDFTDPIDEAQWGFPVRKASHVISQENGELVVNLVNKPNWDGLEFDFFSEKILDLSVNPLVEIKVRSTADCALRIFPWDVLGNYNITYVQNIKANRDTVLTFNLAGYFSKPSTGAIDSTAIRQILFNINPGVAFTGTLFFDYVKAGTALGSYSTVSSLAEIKMNDAVLQGFNKDSLTYNVVLAGGTVAVPAITASATDAKASVKITSPADLPGSATIIVTAENGISKTTYTINFKVAPSVISSLSEIKLAGTLIDGFNSGTLAYNVVLANGTSVAPAITVATTNAKATTDITSPTALPGSAVIVVTAEDGVSKTTYTINFTVALSVVSSLDEIKLGGILVDGFNSATLAYNVALPTGTATAPAITVKTTSAAASASITAPTALPGEASILVTAEDGVTKTTYTINFTVISSVTANKVQFNLYPNPCEDFIMISSTAPVSSISIYSITGTEVLTSTQYTDMIDISTLKKGIYFVKASFNDKSSSITKLIKQ